ncbi:MAG: ABC transporter permease [Planctomycetota bacterium]|nr:ABC transporter permease [Planctomycetota bacterium]
MIASLDNPIVTRALRGRLRGARMFLWPGIYLFILISALMLILLLLRYKVIRDSQAAFESYFWLVVGVDLFVLTLIPAVNTATLFSREKEQGTLQFLRISRLSAFQIAVGHLLGGLALPLILAGSSIPLLLLAAVGANFSLGRILLTAAVVGVYTLFASSLALAVGSMIKKSTTAGGVAAAPLVLMGFLGMIPSFRLSSALWHALNFLSPLNFLIRLAVPGGGRAMPPLIDIPIYGFEVNSYLFNLGLLVFFSVVIITGVSRKIERRSNPFLSPGQTLLTVSFLAFVVSGLFYSAMKGQLSSVWMARGFPAWQLSILIAISVVAIVVNTPGRERLLRSARLGGPGQRMQETWIRSLLFAACLFAICTALLLINLRLHLDAGRTAVAPVGALLACLWFYTVITEEAKLCFGESYKAWTLGTLPLFWVLLPAIGLWTGAEDAGGGVSWILYLGSPPMIFMATLNASDSRFLFGAVSPVTFVLVAIAVHLAIAALLSLHLSRLRMAIVAEMTLAAQGTDMEAQT